MRDLVEAYARIVEGLGAPPGGWTSRDVVPPKPVGKEREDYSVGDIQFQLGPAIRVYVYRGHGKWNPIGLSSTLLRQRAVTYYYDHKETVPAPDFTQVAARKNARSLVQKYFPEYLKPETRLSILEPGDLVARQVT